MIKKMGILQEFIKNKVENYVEPERKGTPKGEPIGFSLVKYEVNLLMLTNLKVKEIAKDWGISEGLLRKWKTERAFKVLEDEHIKDFIQYYTLRMRAKAKEREKLDDTFYNQPFEKIKSSPPKVDISEFLDTGYSYKLRIQLDKHLYYLLKHHRSLLNPKEAIITSEIVLDTWGRVEVEFDISTKKAEKQIISMVTELERKDINQAYENLIEIISYVLSNPSATGYDKNVALSSLETIKKYLLGRFPVPILIASE